MALSRLFLLPVLTLATLPLHAGVIFTCAANVDTAQAGTCATLNSTISGYYTTEFSDVNAKIYIQMGTTGLGSNLSRLTTVSYANYKSALVSDSTSANDATAVANLPTALAAPLPGGGITLTNPLLRALPTLAGPALGYTSTLSSCNISNVGCFDGVVTMSNAASFWYRSGAQGGTQYDFYSVAMHETDEVLGTGGWGSCVNFASDCGTAAGPLDLFRFTSNHNRTFSVGSNTSCTQASDTNACFSIDGGTTLLLGYNNQNNGADTGDYSSACAHLQDSVGCPGQSFNLSASAELLEMDVVGYTRAAAVTPEPGTVSLVALGIAGLLFARRRS